MSGLPIGITPPQGVAARKNSAGTEAGPRRRLNLIEGTGVTLTLADDATDGELDVTVEVTGAPPTGAAGGELGGTYPNPTVDATHSGSAHHAEYTHPNHSGEVTSVGDGAQTVAATHSGSAHHTRSHAITGTSDHTSTATNGQVLKADANGLPVDATNTDAQVADAVTKAHAQSHNHSAAGDGTALAPATLTAPASATPAQTAEGSVVWDSDDDKLTVGTGAGRKTLLNEEDVPGGELGGTWAAPTVDATHSGSAHHTRLHDIDGTSDHNAWTIGLVFIIDGGGSAITTGQKGHLEIPFACTITGWTLLADQSGSIVIDVWKDTYANFPPTVADTIAGTEKPTLSSVQKNQDLTLTTWTTAITAGDILAFNVDSITTVTRVALVLRVTRP